MSREQLNSQSGENTQTISRRALLKRTALASASVFLGLPSTSFASGESVRPTLLAEMDLNLDGGADFEPIPTTLLADSTFREGPAPKGYKNIASLEAGSDVKARGIFGDFIHIDAIVEEADVDGYILKKNIPAEVVAQLPELSVDLVPWIQKNVVENPIEISDSMNNLRGVPIVGSALLSGEQDVRFRIKATMTESPESSTNPSTMGTGARISVVDSQGTGGIDIKYAFGKWKVAGPGVSDSLPNDQDRLVSEDEKSVEVSVRITADGKSYVVEQTGYPDKVVNLEQSLLGEKSGISLVAKVDPKNTVLLQSVTSEYAPDGSAESQKTPTTLKRLAKKAHIHIGSVISPNNFYDPEYQNTVTDQFNQALLDNDTSWKVVRPLPDTFDFTSADQLFNYAKENGMDTHMQHLIWHGNLPFWLGDLNGSNFSSDQLDQLVVDHIQAMGEQYSNKANAVTVVNEAFGDQGGWRQNSFWNAFSNYDANGFPTYFTNAFSAARASFPKSELVLNDFANELPGAKSDTFYNMAVWLQQQGLLDTVGFQMHLLGIQYYDGYRDQVIANLQRFKDAGLKVRITEFTADLRGINGSSDELEALSAKMYSEMLDAALTVGAESFTMFGFQQDTNWMLDEHNSDKGAGVFPWDSSYKETKVAKAMRDVLTAHSKK